MNRPQVVYFPSGQLVQFPSGVRTSGACRVILGGVKAHDAVFKVAEEVRLF